MDQRLADRKSASAQLTRHVVTNDRPVFSQETFAELESRIWRPKFDRYISMENRKKLLLDLGSIAGAGKLLSRF